MTTQSPDAQPDLLEQIRYAIRHTSGSGRPGGCGDEANPSNRHYERAEDALHLVAYRLCNRCAASPNDTGICSSCGRYDLAVEFFAPTLTLCPACLAVKRGQLPGTAIEGEDALW